MSRYFGVLACAPVGGHNFIILTRYLVSEIAIAVLSLEAFGAISLAST